MIHFILAFHNHQPVGNFENIFREAFEKCYDPFLKFLEEHPGFRVSLHYSGCLFDWFEAREKQFLKRLERLVRRNQVELLGGGYYEPILPLIPEEDAVRQMRYMNEYLKDRFGKNPAGFWLTERVWESKIPRLAQRADLRYTTVDDTHFALSGLPESELRQVFITEEEDNPLILFPIPKYLRYVIPFKEPEETLNYLRRFHREGENVVITYADDGEKFGLWPGTYQWVFREGWLDRFAQALEENRSWISLKTFNEVLPEKTTRAFPKAYLPSSSYEEMSEWAMRAEKGREFLNLRRELEALGFWNRTRPYLQGGTFKNFLTKYTEADWMRSKMKWVSKKVSALKNPQQKKAEPELWKGQCNCPYWHGVFGGIYLHHLRRNTYEHLIRAEQFSTSSAERKKISVLQIDLNQDGAEETVIESFPFSFYVAPHRGGSVVELDYHPLAMNLLDTMTRREEAYHGEIFQEKKIAGGAKSIHDIEKTVSPEVIQRIAFDPADRFSFLDFFLDPSTTFEEFWKGKGRILGKDPVHQPYDADWKGNDRQGILTLQSKRLLPAKGKQASIAVSKGIALKKDLSEFQISWKLLNESAEKMDFVWGIEWRFTFFDKERNESGIHQTEIQDGWSPAHLMLLSERAFDYWQFPIETIAQTEKEYRLLHQGISVFPHWSLALEPRKGVEGSLTFRFADGKYQAE